MNDNEFKTACGQENEKLRLLQSEEKEVVSDDTCAKAIIIVKNMKLDGIGDALLYAAALNVLNTYVKQDKEKKKTVGYFFKGNTDALTRYMLNHPCEECRLEIQQDKGMSLLVAEINKLQFSFHQVPITEADTKYLAKDMENPDLKWDGIRKQHNANTLFDFAWNNEYGRGMKMMDGTSFEEGLNALMDEYHAGKKTLSDLKRIVYGTEYTESHASEGKGKKRFSVPSTLSRNYPFRSKSSATLYESDIASFSQAVLNREFVNFMVHQYEEGYGYNVPDLTKTEWKYLFETIRSIFAEFSANPEAGIRFDYVRNRSQELIVLILTSMNKDGKVNTSLTELLSWESMQLTDKQDIVQYRENKGDDAVETIHPSSQLWSFLNNFTKGIHDEDNYELKPCVFFYDTVKSPETDIVTNYVGESTNFAPVFYAQDRENFWNYIKNSASGKDGKKVLNQVRREYDGDPNNTGMAQDQLYAQHLLFRSMNKYPSFFYVVDGRSNTGKSSLIEAVTEIYPKKKYWLVNKKNASQPIPEEATLVIYDDVIPKEVDFKEHPYQLLFFDPFTKNSSEKSELLELQDEAEAQGAKIITQSLTTAPGFKDLGCGNNWLIRHFALGLIQPQDWDSAKYPITIVDSKEDLKEEDGIACVTIPATIHVSEDDGKIVYTEGERIELYKQFAKGTRGIKLWIEDKALRERIRGELNKTLNRYSWIDRFIHEYQGDTQKLMEAQQEVFKNSTVRNKYEQIAISSLGKSAWNKMTEETRNWVLSALLSYNDMKNYDQMMDFSGVVVQICKSIESELATRLVAEYLDWAKETYGEENYIQELPQALTDEYNETVRAVLPSRVSLGSFSFIMGMDRNCNVVNEKDFENFKKFAKARLFANPEADPLPIMKDMVHIIDHIRADFRNKAAHKDTMDIVSARNCIEYCIVGDRKLGVLLDYFRF